MNQDLPEPDFSFDCDGTPCYYASTVRSLIAAAVERERERCAKVCEEVAAPYQAAGASVALECAAAIREGGRDEMSELEARVLCVAVVHVGEPIYSDRSTLVTICDDTGGEYVEVSQAGRSDLGKIAIDPDEWPALRDAIESRVKECRGEMK